MNNYLLFLTSVLLLILTSCEKNIEQDIIDTPTEQNIESRSFNGNSNHPFYQVNYVEEQLDINLNRVVSSNAIYYMMNHLESMENDMEFAQIFENHSSYPCWSCGETDYNDNAEVDLVLVPVVDIPNAEVNALLIRETNNTTLQQTVLYLYRGLVEYYNSINPEGPYRYYSIQFEYFESLIRNENPDYIQFSYKSAHRCSYTEASTDQCECVGTGVLCPKDSNGICDDSACENVENPTDEEIDAGDSSTGGPKDPPLPPTEIDNSWIIWLDIWDRTFPDNPISYPGNGGGTTGDIAFPTNTGLDLIDILSAIEELIIYIKDNTDIDLTSATLDILNSFEYFDLITYSLNNTKESLSEDELQAFISFITNFPDFIKTPSESLFLQFNMSITMGLETFLLNHNDELGMQLGYASIALFMNGTNQYSGRQHYNQLGEVYNNHLYLLNAYPEFADENIDIVLFLIEHGIDAYNATKTMYDLFKQELDEYPAFQYQWQLAMEEFREIVILGLGIIPGIGDLVSAYDNISQGHIFWGCFDLAGALFPNELIKVVRNASKIRDAFRGVKAFWRIWNVIGNLPGSNKVFNALPDAWKALPDSKIANNGKGLAWNLNPLSHHFRLMEAVPGSSIVNKQVPYSRFFKSGSGTGYMTTTGDWMVPTKNTNEYIHNGVTYLKGDPIFQELTHIPINDITDEMLDLFF